VVGTIALLTDFGASSAYVGVMKGVLAKLAPDARIVDLSHNVRPGDVKRAAFELWQAVPYFPVNTVFMVVVDPGVGTHRKPVAIRWKDRMGVGPDNGVFTYLLATHEPPTAVELTSRIHRLPVVSSTFHGRDLFAPAAAHLANGGQIEELGPKTQDLKRLPLPKLELVEGPCLIGEFLHADPFGNLITSIGRLHREENELLLEPWLPHCPPARLDWEGLKVNLPNGARLQLNTTFGDVPEGEVVAYIGSSGQLEIAINQGRAVDALPFQEGQEIQISYKG
jgi:S-adenosylmethionine hydrolase